MMTKTDKKPVNDDYKPHGEWVVYFGGDNRFSGKLNYIINYHNGIKHGLTTHYNPSNDTIRNRGNFNMGKKVGPWAYHYASGKTLLKEYINNNGKVEGIYLDNIK